MVNTDTIRTIVGALGNLLSFGLFASPVPTIWRIFKKKDVEEFSFVPYVAGVMNCLFWVLYGLPLINPNNLLVVSINSIGLALELVYLACFLLYGNKKQRFIIPILVVIEFAVAIATGLLVIKLVHTHKGRSRIVGIFSTVFSICLYASPLSIMFKVIRTKSVEYMPFLISLTAFLNGICWTVYALLKFDLYIMLANGIGAVLGLCQLILYACYYKTTPKKGKQSKSTPKSELQLPRVSEA